MYKKLYRSTTDKIFAGVCGGVGEYTGLDSTVIRLLWVLVVIFTGFVPGVIVYIIAALIVPIKGATPPADTSSTSDQKQS